MTEQRLPEPFGHYLDRQQSLSFTFEGKTYSGLKGDSLASALVANGQWLMSRSFKYHRPRGSLTLAGHDANTLVTVDGVANLLADKTPLQADAVITGQHYKGSLQHDRLSVINYFSRFLPVAFYYKAFYRPRGIWQWWAKWFRRQAGLGVIEPTIDIRDKQRFDKQYLFADVLVIGGGPAGLSSALAAAEQGVEVLLVDENPKIGGWLNYAPTALRQAQLERISTVSNHPNIRILCDTVCNSWHDDHYLALIKGSRLYKTRCRQVIVATGSIEQVAVFRGNDLPGVCLSSAVSRLLHQYAVKPGDNIAVLAGNDEAYLSALDWLDSGLNVTTLVDLREQAENTELLDRVREKAVDVYLAAVVYEAKKHKSVHRVAAIEICTAGQSKTVACDVLACSVGFMPTWQLVCQAGGQLAYDDARAEFSLSGCPPGMHLAGSVVGAWQMDALYAHAIEVGAVAAQNALNGQLDTAPVFSQKSERVQLNHPWPIVPHKNGKEFVDFDEDLHIRDILNSVADGYQHIQLLKRYSTCGMGPSQGRHSALPAARLVAQETGKTVSETGVTTARPPVAAEFLAHNAGRSFYPFRQTPMHDWHIEMGAQMLQAGQWYRPAFYGDTEYRVQQIASEVRAVRERVGLIDVSTLGGLEIRGPQASEFIERIYTGAFAKLVVGKTRYALMTNEAGVVIDDGVVCRLHDEYFYITATTTGVDRVYREMLRWQAIWNLDVDISNVTSAFCAMNIAGPKSREVLERLQSDIDFSARAFPYLAVRQGSIEGIKARVMRVGFVGELGFEIHLPTFSALSLWQAIIDAGQAFAIQPFGIESQRVLRLEKGHIIIGQDTDAMSTPSELAMRWAVADKKAFFVGQRTLRELAQQPPLRRLVGFQCQSAQADLIKESQLIVAGEKIQGRVTSCEWSPSLNCVLGLAYVTPDLAQTGNTLQIRIDSGCLVSASVAHWPFYDAQGQRQAC